jgi:hypothetical protein
MAAADVEMQPADISSVATFAEDDKDLYVKLKALQRQMEFLEIQVRSCKSWSAFLELLITCLLRHALACGPGTLQRVIQEEYIKEEQRNLKRELLRAEEEVKRIQSVPLFIGQFLEMVDANSGVVSSTTGMIHLSLGSPSLGGSGLHDRL